MVKQFLLLISIFISSSVPVAYAVDSTNPHRQVNGILRTLDRVDHTHHYLVVDDEVFYMPMNFKVYIQDPSSRSPRLVNRYALKEGQSVYIGVSGSPKKPYVNVLIIEK
jgi:hypothetical protein